MGSMLEYKGYRATVEYDSEDEIFVGEVFGIMDSLNFHGSSVSELKQMFHQSVDNYLEYCERAGKVPEKEYRGQFNVRISPKLHRMASLYAAENHTTLNQVVTRALELILSQQTTQGESQKIKG